MNTLIRLSRLASVALGLVVLAGCATQEDPLQKQADAMVAQINAKIRDEVDADFKQMIREKEAVRDAVSGNMYNTTTQAIVGVAMLEVTFDRQGRATKCEIIPPDQRLLDMVPFKTPHSDPQQFTEYLKQQCLDTIFPAFPEEQYSAEGLLTKSVPVAADFNAEKSREMLSNNAQSEFFRKQLLRGEKFDSVGVVQASYRANAQGKLTACGINLVPLPSRRNDFVLDPALQERLMNRCKTINVRQMPGFSANNAQSQTQEAFMKYTPWNAVKE